MFNRTLVKSMLAELADRQCGAVATLMLARFRRMFMADAREEVTSESTQQVVQDAYNYCLRKAAGEVVSSTAIRARFNELLGPDESPFEDPEEIEPWFIDLVSTADYAVRTWERPDVSGSVCFDALLSAYSIAGGLEDDPELTPTSPLGQLEFERQIADMRAIQSGVGVEELIEIGGQLAQAYAERFLEYIHHYQG